jgi:hypothetical protein
MDMKAVLKASLILLALAALALMAAFVWIGARGTRRD